MRPETRYARSRDVTIAYQVVGDGPRDLVLVHGVPGEWHLFAVESDRKDFSL